MVTWCDDLMERVLVVSERYWPDGSGGELATHLIVGLLRDAFDVTVVTGSRNVARHENVRYVYEPLLSRREKPILWLNVGRLVGKDRFRRLLREVDIVYVPRFSFPLIPYARSMGKRVVVHLHDYIPISYTATILAPYEEHKDRVARDDIRLECMKGVKYCVASLALWWLPKLARRWIAQADKVICVSKRQANIVLDALPELKGRVEVVYNPLPAEVISANPAKEPSEIPTFLYVGGDSYIKGFDILLQTVRILDGKGVKAKLILTNRYGNKAKDRIQSLKQKLNHIFIEVVGRIGYRKLVEIHRYAWALLFPSIWEETFGYAVAEAMALGTIPVAFRVGGVLELISSTRAKDFLIKPSSSEALIKAIMKLVLLTPDQIKKLGHELRQHILNVISNVEIKNKLTTILRS